MIMIDQRKAASHRAESRERRKENVTAAILFGIILALYGFADAIVNWLVPVV